MLDWQESGSLALRQVEMNTIAAGMAGLSSRLKSFHEYVCSRYARRPINVPDNTCLTSTVDAIAMAWAEYGSEDAVVMIITFPSENNLFDQRAVEFDLWQR
jgi:glutathione synthase